MRIISGIHKGRRIQAPKKLPVRPTTDMAKEALFNIINNQFYFDELSVLDLFAGIGSISLEFASRGTTDITSVESDYGCGKFISETAQKLNLSIHVITTDVYKYLETCNREFTIIFADPPYNFSDILFTDIHRLVFDNKLLENAGLLIIEHSKHTDLSQLQHFIYSKTYGGNSFSFFKQL